VNSESNFALPPVVDYHPIPRSTAVLQVAREQGSGAACAIVRCKDCSHRLFDVFEREIQVGWYAEIDVAEYETQLFVARKCPRCKSANTRHVTAKPGHPVGEFGPWRCHHCSSFLARIDAPRGRLILMCNKTGCKHEVRVTAAEVFHALKHLEAAKRPECADDDFGDVPF
jgi:phage FluMu protein Com